MTLDQLKYFYEAARFQHVGKGAKAASISPSAISASIAAIEHELGVQLFDRVGKSIFLTDAGKRLQCEAEILLDQFKGIKLKVTGIETKLDGHFRLGASHYLASQVLTKAWSALQNEHVKLIGEISSLPTSTVISDVVSGALDFGLCFSPFQHPELHIEEIYQGQLQVAMRANHPLMKLKLNPSKHIKLLSNYPAVIHKAHVGVDICEHHPVFDQFGVEVKPAFLFDSDACAIEKLIHSDAWGLIPDLVVRHYSKKITSMKTPTHWNAPYTVSFVMRRERVKNGVFLKMKEAISMQLNQ